MKKGIFCSKCGTCNLPSHFTCSQCHAPIRPLYPTVIATVTLLGVYAWWLWYVKAVIPVFAKILAANGAKFSPFVRLALDLGQAFTGWGSIFGLALLGVLLWIGLFFKPQKPFGSDLVVTVALAKAAGALLFALLSLLDVLPFIAAN